VVGALCILPLQRISFASSKKGEVALPMWDRKPNSAGYADRYTPMISSMRTLYSSMLVSSPDFKGVG